MPDILISIENLNISFYRDKAPLKVISDLSFFIKSSEVFGLVGESGCGKSLTALSILRLIPENAFSEGKIIFKNKDLLSITDEEIRMVRGKDISMIFQEPMTSLNPVMRIGDQIAEVLINHLKVSKKEAKNIAVDLLRAVKMPYPENRIKDYPHLLSGGMRQRVMIAMAIACNPSLLIADEPTTALDVTIQAQILELLQSLRRQLNMAILLITHDLSIVSEQADRVAIMYAGRIMELAKVDSIFQNPLHPYTIGLLESLPVAKGVPLKPIKGFVPEPDKFPPGCKYYDRCHKATNECNISEPKLIEVTTGHFVRCHLID